MSRPYRHATAPAPRTMVARFAGTCRTCAGSIRPGDPIVSVRGRGAWHTDCRDTTATWRERYGRCEDAPCCGCCS